MCFSGYAQSLNKVNKPIYQHFSNRSTIETFHSDPFRTVQRPMRTTHAAMWEDLLQRPTLPIQRHDLSLKTKLSASRSKWQNRLGSRLPGDWRFRSELVTFQYRLNQASPNLEKYVVTCHYFAFLPMFLKLNTLSG